MDLAFFFVLALILLTRILCIEASILAPLRQMLDQSCATVLLKSPGISVIEEVILLGVCVKCLFFFHRHCWLKKTVLAHQAF